jgi:hypothetical protein
MRGVPRSPVTCKQCKKENGCPKDNLCHACRVTSRPNPRKQYAWTPDLEARLAECYRRARNKEELTAGLNAMQRSTGFTRNVILAQAAQAGLSFCQRRIWTPEELGYLQENAGRISIAAMARELGRTYWSIKRRAAVLRLRGRVTEGYSADDLTRLMGVGRLTLIRWIAKGWISQQDGRIPEASVLRFLRTRPHEYQLRRMDEAWFKGLVFTAFDRPSGKHALPGGAGQLGEEKRGGRQYAQNGTYSL